MRAVKTIISISFLLIAATVVADDSKKSNELPDEIKNLNRKEILNSIKLEYKYDPNKMKTILPENTSVVVKVKLKRNGTVDTAAVVYCEESDVGFEESALQAVLEATFRPKSRRGRVNKSWFYTEVLFKRIGYYFPPGTDSSDSSDDSSRLNSSEFVPVEVQPEIIWKSVPGYPRRARQDGVEAVVFVRVLIGVIGIPLDAFIQKSGDPDGKYGFDKAALDGAMKCRFKPATRDGIPVKVWVSFPYEFILKGHR